MNIHLLNYCKIIISSCVSSKLYISDDRISRMYPFSVQPSVSAEFRVSSAWEEFGQCNPVV